MQALIVEVRELRLAVERATAAVRNIEARLAAEQDVTRKEALERERREMAAQVDDQRQQAQQAQLRESELSSALRTEAARVDELIQRLAVLEQSLAAK